VNKTQTVGEKKWTSCVNTASIFSITPIRVDRTRLFAVSVKILGKSIKKDDLNA
jgi:hypothetical protein